MARYIDAEKITRELLDEYGWFDSEQIDNVMQMIDDVQTADVKPITYAKWERIPLVYIKDSRVICSNCNSVETPLPRHNYCPY